LRLQEFSAQTRELHRCYPLSAEDTLQLEMEPTRRTPRYPFTAHAEVAPEPSGAPFPATVKELSLYGCYLDTGAPLNNKTKVVLKIVGKDDFFEANATVIYSNPRLGMGLVFHNVKPHYISVLRKWLLVAMQERKEMDQPEPDPEKGL
jgi:hypothetical protein